MIISHDCMNAGRLQCSLQTERLCDDGKKCIKRWNYCDGTVDCDDGSDENSCQVSSTTCKFVMIITTTSWTPFL